MMITAKRRISNSRDNKESSANPKRTQTKKHQNNPSKKSMLNKPTQQSKKQYLRSAYSDTVGRMKLNYLDSSQGINKKFVYLRQARMDTKTDSKRICQHRSNESKMLKRRENTMRKTKTKWTRMHTIDIKRGWKKEIDLSRKENCSTFKSKSNN